MIVPALLIVFAHAGRGAEPKREPVFITLSPEDAALARKASEVVVRDGIDHAEAAILAWAYYQRIMPGCGMVCPPVRRGEAWSAEVLRSYAGFPAGSIRIDARTGACSYDGPLRRFEVIYSTGLVFQRVRVEKGGVPLPIVLPKDFLQPEPRARIVDGPR